MKVKDLVRLLQAMDQNKNVFIASLPDINGWVNDPLPYLGTTGEDNAVVIGAREETSFEEEVVVKWPKRPIS